MAIKCAICNFVLFRWTGKGFFAYAADIDLSDFISTDECMNVCKKVLRLLFQPRLLFFLKRLLGEKRCNSQQTNVKIQTYQSVQDRMT